MGSTAKNLSLFCFCLVLSAVILTPQARERLTAFLNPDARTVLATLPMQTPQGRFKIVKLRKGEHISIEIYKLNEASVTGDLYATFEIPDSKDVFYDFKSTISNLFEANIDDDPTTEIIIPVMDHNLVARLNVIKFDPQSQHFTHHEM